MIELTDNAITHIMEQLKNEGDIIRVGLKPAGCAGFEYEWGTYKTQDELLNDDEVIKTDNNYSFVIGSASMMFLFGTIIDYKKDIMGSMFDIVNPNAKSSCGCGVSVNFDMDKLGIPA